jgi:hypothetical protein
LPEIRIGQTVDIVVERGVIKASSIQDIFDGRIVLVQIIPPLSKSYIGKTVLITYLVREGQSMRRGFRAKIVEMREGYVTAGRGFPAIIVNTISESELCNLRVHERHQPELEIEIHIGADCLEIINISDSGAHVVRSAGKRSTLKVDDMVLLTIRNGKEQCDRQAMIIRLWHTKGTEGPEHLAVIFTPPEKNIQLPP